MQREGNFAGSIQYHPRTGLDDDTLALLRRKLVEAGAVQEPENQTVVIDWQFAERNANRTLLRRRSIVLLRDGGDVGLPAVIFYRREEQRQTGERVESYHIPEQSDQLRLADAWRWWDDPTGEKLKTLNAYLDRVADDLAAWQPF